MYSRCIICNHRCSDESMTFCAPHGSQFARIEKRSSRGSQLRWVANQARRWARTPAERRVRGRS